MIFRHCVDIYIYIRVRREMKYYHTRSDRKLCIEYHFVTIEKRRKKNCRYNIVRIRVIFNISDSFIFGSKRHNTVCLSNKRFNLEYVILIFQ